MEPVKKEYLGDSVYAEFDGNGIVLTTENGEDPSNTIYLEPEVYAALLRYVERFKAALTMIILICATSALAGEPAPAPATKAVKTIKVDKPVKIKVTPTVPGTTIVDFERAGIKIVQVGENKIVVWPTIEGTTIKDFSQPARTIEKNTDGKTIMNTTIPGTTIKDFDASSYIIKQEQ